MSCLRRCLIISLVLSVCRTAQADSGAAEPLFIGEVNLITSWKHEASIDQSVVESFKELLRRHGYQTDECEENTAAWQRLAAWSASPDDPDMYKKVDERLLAAQKCKIPSSATRAYDVKLVLTFDAELQSRRAIIHLIALGDYPSIDGGYAHKPSQLMSWYDLMNRAIERALSRYNDATAVHVSVPTEAIVGETVHLDARESWDPDGDAFELRWRVDVQACAGAGQALPRDKRRCPTGLEPGGAPVQNQAGDHDLTREFRVPMVGDYEIGVYAKVGAHEQLVQSYRLRARPRRTWTVFSRQGLLRLPRYFLSNSSKQELAIIQGFGLLRRFIHRIGLYGWFEEIHYGLAMNPMSQLSTFNYQDNMGLLYSVEILARTLDRTGRYGVASSTTLSLLTAYASRGAGERTEWGAVVSTMIGWYYSFGENYLDKMTQYCDSVCPSVTLGPNLTSMNNFTASKFGLVLGGEAVFAIEF